MGRITRLTAEGYLKRLPAGVQNDAVFVTADGKHFVFEVKHTDVKPGNSLKLDGVNYIGNVSENEFIRNVTDQTKDNRWFK